MPSVQDIVEMADLLKVRSIGIEQDKCVVVRNRNATCTKCMDACIASCISASRNELDIDADLCTNCGACIAVCPNDAFFALEPDIASLARSIAERSDAASGLCAIACSRKAAKHEADVERFTEVPCLAHIGETLLVECAASGLDDIVLVDGNCSTCKYGAASAAIDASVDNAMDILDAARSTAIVTRTSSFPDEISVAPGSKKSFRGEDRRGLLKQTGGYMRQVATNVAKKTIDDKLGADKPKTLRERLSAGQSGRMPSFEPERNFELIDAMAKILEKAGVDAYGEDAESMSYLADTMMSTRHFGSISIDLDKCSGCGLCVLFCPTEALCHSQFEQPEDPDRKYLEFSASLCTQCGLCEDVCIRKCLAIGSRVSLASVFDMEPELVEINKPEDRVSIFDLNRDRNRNKA